MGTVNHNRKLLVNLKPLGLFQHIKKIHNHNAFRQRVATSQQPTLMLNIWVYDPVPSLWKTIGSMACRYMM